MSEVIPGLFNLWYCPAADTHFFLDMTQQQLKSVKDKMKVAKVLNFTS